MDIEYVYAPARDDVPDGKYTIVRMRYSAYKKHYSDCKTVPGTYDSDARSIEVYMPDGRMKASGVRGHHYLYFRLKAIDSDGDEIEIPYKAINFPNAYKQHLKVCRENGYTSLERCDLID